MSFDAQIKNRVRIELGWLNQAEQQQLGDFAISEIRTRIAGGVDRNDQPARPLTRRYEKQKVRRGGAPLRNLTLSGGALRSLAVVGRGDAIRIAFQDPKAPQKLASRRNAVLFGLSPANQAAVVAEHDELLARSVQEMFVSVR